MISQHCQDYHILPVNSEHLVMTLGRAYGMASLSVGKDKEVNHRPPELVGISPAMQELFHGIKKAAQVDAPVLIGGESGTGKELIAAAIHQCSGRAKRPFVAVNCGALAANLVQSELFGHERGAFTGAASRKIGRIEAANQGTIFLDEIGDLPLELQANLLRFLQEQTIERVGSHQSIKTDVRVIAATHVDLEQAVKQGDFRQDLYYRLNVLHLYAPPLCQRSGDIELMAHFFFHKFAKEKSSKVQGFSQQAINAMRQYHWPGNVRELINRIRRAMVMCDNRLICPQDLGLNEQSQHNEQHPLNLEQARAVAEADAIGSALAHTEQNISCAARILGVSRVTLYRLIKKYNISLD
jgi:DNA-binding NtrC family response regulator